MSKVLEVTDTEVTVNVGSTSHGSRRVVDYTTLDNDLLVMLTRTGAEELRDALTEALQGARS